MPGSCGELVQGTLDDVHFHITCPVDLYATVQVKLVPGSGRVHGAQDCPKARRAAAIALSRFGSNSDAVLSVVSELPRGKGMASSTADVVATVSGIFAAFGSDVPPNTVADIALQVEPSDGLMYPGIALFDHRNGKARRVIGRAPPMHVLVLDFGGIIDTVAFNLTDRTAELQRLESRWRKAAALVENGIKSGSAEMVGEGATISSLAHQAILPKPQLDAVMQFGRELRSVGVNVAHSGSVLGLLFDGDRDRAEFAKAKALDRLPGLERVYLQRLVDGGAIVAGAPREITVP